MKNTDPRFQAFCRFVEAERIPLDFPAVCRRLRVPPGELNELLLDELGTCGEEIILQASKYDLRLAVKMIRFADLTNN